MTTVLSTDRLAEACRIFARHAHTRGEHAIPASVQRIVEMPCGQALFEILAIDAALKDCCIVAHSKTGRPSSLMVRLGCDHYPHLKLKADLVEGSDEGWLFSVDTHDSFSETSFLPPSDHPDAPAWRALQVANVALKHAIEAAWENAGIPTFNSLLRRQLQTHQPTPA